MKLFDGTALKLLQFSTSTDILSAIDCKTAIIGIYEYNTEQNCYSITCIVAATSYIC